MSLRTKILKVAVPIAIIAAGAGIMAALVGSREAPTKQARRDPGALVRAIEAKPENRNAVVAGTGTAQPARVVTVIPQVAGRVIRVSAGLVAGGIFKKGELLFEIEAADYKLEVEKAEAARARAEYDLERIKSQARVARGEWERLNGKDGEKPNPLVIYEPQLKDARAAMKSAEAAVKRAKLDLERTRVAAPFNCLVRSEEIEMGAYVRPGTAVAVLAGTDAAEIVVPLPVEELLWIDMPYLARANSRRAGSPATVAMDLGGKRVEWTGRITRSLGEVDPKGRMMQAVVTVDDPYGLSRGKAAHVPLAFGTFVDVKIDGRPLEGVVSIPRGALREGSTVWTAEGGTTLRMKKVEVLRFEQDEVILKSGLADGDIVVTTNLAGAADGMKLRVTGNGIEDNGS